MSIHRTIDGRRRIAEWCEAALDRWPPHERVILDSPLGATHVTSTGDGEQTLVWLPGTNFNAAVHADLARRLVDDGRFRLHMVDLPGQPGLSSPQSLGRDRMVRYGDWLPNVLTGIDDPGPITLVGHSLGAAVVLASTPTNRADRAVLLSPAGLAKLRITA
ncbi:MAG: alpha/beta hydrolase, partial [Acidimicrobiia bacterium]|nr:alpha/beta hydrolase [Acidimicrobiia bacterium]